jgi:RimJ/RimL family protein N-acetyltransferase
VELVPLGVEHAPALLALIDREMWRGMVSPQPLTLEDAARYVDGLVGRGDGVAFAVLDRATRAVRGSTAFYEHVPDQGRVEIGYTFYGRRYWGGTTNPWCKLLMLEHAFTVWRVHRVAMRCDVRNTRSRAAILRLGATPEGVLRGHRLGADGVRSDSLVFSVLAPEWPTVRGGIERRLRGTAAAARARAVPLTTDGAP